MLLRADCTIWQSVPWDSQKIIIVLARTCSNLPVSQLCTVETDVTGVYKCCCALQTSFPAFVFTYTSKLEISQFERHSFACAPAVYCDTVQINNHTPEEERVKKGKLPL